MISPFKILIHLYFFKGSDVSKQAADMILLDDDFATIVIGVEEGRKIFDNMKKTVSYMMVGSVTTLYPYVVYILFGFPLALGTITVLLICLGTDMMPAISLAYENAESNIMAWPPRNPVTDKLVTSKLLFRCYLLVGVIETMSGFMGYFVYMIHYGWKPWHLFNIREQWDDQNNNILKDSFGNPWV
jgi:sodium/potassium-transporting ATPase subunit alpha